MPSLTSLHSANPVAGYRDSTRTIAAQRRRGSSLAPGPTNPRGRTGMGWLSQSTPISGPVLEHPFAAEYRA